MANCARCLVTQYWQCANQHSLCQVSHRVATGLPVWLKSLVWLSLRQKPDAASFKADALTPDYQSRQVDMCDAYVFVLLTSLLFVMMLLWVKMLNEVAYLTFFTSSVGKFSLFTLFFMYSKSWLHKCLAASECCVVDQWMAAIFVCITVSSSLEENNGDDDDDDKRDDEYENDISSNNNDNVNWKAPNSDTYTFFLLAVFWELIQTSSIFLQKWDCYPTDKLKIKIILTCFLLSQWILSYYS